MNRLPYEITKVFYDTLGLEFEKFNPAQFAAISAEDRFPLLGGGERGGKSFASAAILLPHLYLLPEVRRERFYLPNGTLRYNPNVKRPLSPDFSIFGPTYAEPTIEFGYIENWLRELDDISYLSKPKEGSWALVTKKGVVLTTWSTKDPATIRAIDLEGAIATEAGNMEEDAIYRINGRVGAKRGFIVYNGTFENAKRWYIRWAQEGERQNNKRIKTYHLPSWSNLHEFPGGRNDDEIKRWEELYPEDLFAIRVAAEPLPPRDRVIQEINESAIRKVKIPRTPTGEIDARIELAIDPGYLPSAYAVLWVASWETEKGRFWYVFDELYEQRKETTEIIDAIKLHKFYKTCRSDDLTIDVSSKRHADGNEPSIEIYRRLTKFKNPYMKYWHEKALIERIRTTAKQGLIAIHPNCTGLIAEMGLGEEVFPDMHPWKYPSNREGVIIGDKPKDAWNHCHDGETEILTERGWIKFNDLSDTDNVAVWGDKMTFEKPSAIIREQFSGNLLARSGNNIDFAVTEGHRMWVANQYSVQKKEQPEFSLVRADELPSRAWVSRVAPGWGGINPSLSFQQRTKSGYHTVTPTADAFARFYGLWLAEGCLGRGGGKKYVIVDQKKYVDEVRDVVANTGFNWCETVNKDGVVRFSIQSKELYAYLLQNGEHSVAETKRVKREWINSSIDTIKALLDGYRMGDGSAYDKEGWWYGSSVSKGLLDDLQEMAFRAGIPTNVYKAHEAEGNKLEAWYIGVSGEKRGASRLGLVTLQSEDIELRPYEGEVFCVTTDAGIIATRRNGRIMWSGNSAKALGYLLLRHLGQVERLGDRPKPKNRIAEKKTIFDKKNKRGY